MRGEQPGVKKQGRRYRAQSLRSKLTRSYLWMTVLAVLAIELIVGLLAIAVAAVEFRPALSPAQATIEAQQLAARLRPLARSLSVASLPVSSAAEVQKLVAWPQRKGVTLVVTNAQLVVLAAAPKDEMRVGMALKDHELSSAMPLNTIVALSRGANPQGAAERARDGGSIAVAPIRVAGSTVGLAWVRSAPPGNAWDFFEAMVGTIIASTMAVGFFASAVGAGFGWFTTRRLTHRLEAIEAASAAWGRGEFSVLAVDEANDEIGRLARRLNAMTQEFRELVALRQTLATAEERNRLARELHDTVKQQVFATTMQIGAAKVLLERDMATDRDLVRSRLDTAEELARGAQRELTAILEQLRPGSYFHSAQNTLEAISDHAETGSREWIKDIYDLANEWSRQNGIKLSFQCDIQPPLMPASAGQSLLRLVQEGLANIARHSNATHSRIQFWLQELPNSSQATLIVEIIDNGCGFKSDSAGPGLGLQTMRERAELLRKGSLVVESRPGQGTCLRVRCQCEL